jgi:hypothetical protein
MAEPIERLTKAGRDLYALREEKDALEARLKVVNEAKRDLEERDIPKMMEDFEIESLRIEGIGTLFTKGELHAYIRVDDQEQAYSWLEERNMDDIIKRTIHHGTLKSWAKEQLDEGVELPAFFNIKLYRKAQLRRS